MLRELVVENLGVIERADLELGPGSSALTGETGAGKTLLVEALSLLLGARADRSLIRDGAESAVVEARFVVDDSDAAAAVARSLGLMQEGSSELVLSRTLTATGGKVRINGRIAAVSTLGELGPALVEIAGQHEHQELSSPAKQLAVLDAFAGPDAVALGKRVAAAFREAAVARKRAEQLIATERERERERAALEHEIAEIEAANIQPEETERLKVVADRLEHAELIGRAVEEARAAIASEGRASDLVRQAADLLDRVVVRDPGLAQAVARLRSALVDLEDLSLDLGAHIPAVDPVALEETRQRIAELARLQRRYGADDSAVLAHLSAALERRAQLETAASQVEEAEAEAELQSKLARDLAMQLSSLRSAAAPRLAAVVASILEELAMGSTRIEVELIPVELNQGGLESFEIRIANPGQSARPLGKIASGGELSRLALALRVASGNAGGFAPTVVFDEVDAGVGGEAARAVGRYLADLSHSAGVQTLVVTHLPQVAAFADAHYRVEKLTGEGASRAAVSRLVDEERVGEVSRMLAGLPDSDRAREHAQELLEIAGTR